MRVLICIRLMLVAGVSAMALGQEPVAAQDTVRVVDAMGLPVPAIRIEVYGLAELLHIVSSDEDGVAIIPPERREEIRRLSLSHLAFRTLIVQSDDFEPSATLRLEPMPIGLEGLEVEVRGQLCPVEETPEARRLWSEVAGRYSPDTGRRRLTASYLYSAGSVSETSLHQVSTTAMAPLNASRLPTAGSRSEVAAGPLEIVVGRDGYSWRPLQQRWGRRDLNRVYPSFEMWHAYHFATSTFGDLHDFSIIRSGEESVLLAFCPRREDDRTRLMGTLELIPERRFLSASWRFLVDDPDEDAGGEADFIDFREGTRRLPHLLSTRGLFFRHNGKDPPYPDVPRAYYREAFARIEWRALPLGR